MNVLNTILAITALLGWLPPLLCLLIIHFALAHGAREWPDIIFDAVFVSLYAVFVSGKYAYAVNNSGNTIAVVDLKGADISTANIGNIAANDLTVWENVDIGNNLYVKK